MHFSAAKQNTTAGSGSTVDELVRQIGRLLRHPLYRRSAVVSPPLLRHLPFERGYQWQGEAELRERLLRAQLDAGTLNHLTFGARSEYDRLRGPADT